MERETDSQEVIELSSDSVVGQSLTTTIYASGGVGGQGGRGGQDGGTGGNGEGGTVNVSRAERLTVYVHNGRAWKNSNPDGSRAYSRRGRNSVQTYYTAKVKDQKELMTVVVYEGKNAEEKFKKDVAKYMEFRHPSFLQLFGTVHSGNIYATIFYDVLIPWKDIERIYDPFPVVACYIYVSMVKEFDAASDYFRYRFGSSLHRIDYTLFLRLSGQLCIDLEWSDHIVASISTGTENVSPMSLSLLSSIDTQIIIDALTIEQYHEICYLGLRDTTYTQFPLTATAHLGAVYHPTGHHDLGNPVATAPTPDIDDCFSRAWYVSSSVDSVDPHITESGWNRFTVSQLIGRDLEGKIKVYLWATLQNSDLWFSQANHILNRLGVFSNAVNYALLNMIMFEVELNPQPATPTDWHSSNAFLFLCPPESFHVGPASFKCPECVGYWSFDPLGQDQLSSEQASELGFPAITISIRGEIYNWSDTIYAGLRQFHQGKGFDPDSQDVAPHLGVPLYELYSVYDDSMDVDDDNFEAHIEEVSSSDSDTDQPMDID